jgi:hypothetical protein
VGLASTPLLPANKKRLAVYFTNGGANPVWITFKVAAVVYQGILIPPGEMREFEINQESQLWKRGKIDAIALGGTSDVGYYEQVVP